jgi:FkbM family methyltransferase
MKDFFLRNFNRITVPFGFRLISDDIGSNAVILLKGLISRFKVNLFLDVGANAGQTTLKLIANGFDGRILSFEPVPGPYGKLASRAARYPKWKALPVAIGDINGQIEVHVAGNLESSSVLPMLERHKTAAPGSEEINRVQAELRRLDSYLEEGLILKEDNIFLKIDVQGFEMQALNGSAGILGQVKILQMELSLVPLYEGSLLFEDLMARLKKLGFTLFTLLPGFSDPVSGQLLQMDGVFIRE